MYPFRLTTSQVLPQTGGYWLLYLTDTWLLGTVLNTHGYWLLYSMTQMAAGYCTQQTQVATGQ